jgi:hypothetical protein
VIAALSTPRVYRTLGASGMVSSTDLATHVPHRNGADGDNALPAKALKREIICCAGGLRGMRNAKLIGKRY